MQRDKLQLPQYFEYQALSYKGLLSCRALRSALDQATDIVRSQIEKRKNILYVLATVKLLPKRRSYLEEQLVKHPL